jgi:dTDP-4-amino-4,6-dideoxygalactose transaminase
MSRKDNLAVNGGPKTIASPLKNRFHFGKEERAAAMTLFEEAEKSGSPFGYNGPQEDAFCKEFAEFLGGGFADGVNSGTNAVYVALKALDLPPFSEVIVGCVTDPGGIMPIVINNCVPIVADTMPGSYNTGAAMIEPLISERTRAIVVAHIGGEPADMPAIMRLAEKHKLAVVEDCAQSHMARINGQNAGTFGTVGAFSLMFGKHFCCGGQGGAVFSKSEDVYWSLRRAADRGKPFGLPAGSTNCVPALNCNLDELGAAIGRVQLKKLPDIVARRQKLVKMITEMGLGKLEAVKIPEQRKGFDHCYWWWKLRVDTTKISCSKDEFCAALIAEGVPMAANYTAALPATMDWFKNRSSQHPWNSPLYKGDPKREFPCPNAMEVMRTHFNLSVSESWGEAEAELLLKAFRKVGTALLKKNE